jgi:hypothetical protein
MIKNFHKYNEEFNLFGKKKPEEKKDEKPDWRDMTKGTCHVKSVSDFFNNNCGGNENTFLRYFNEIVADKDITIAETRERFRGRPLWRRELGRCR